MTGGADVVELKRRAYQHTLQDGLTEILAAIMFLASVAMLQQRGLICFIGLAMVLLPVVINRLKAKVTYPRTGYLELRDQPPKRIVWGMFLVIGAAIVLMALLLLVAGRLDDPASWRRWAPLLAGFLVSCGFHHAAQRSGLLRFRCYELMSLAAGLLISILGSGHSYAGVQIYCLVMAGATMLGGVVHLVRFVQRNPVRIAEEPRHVEQ